MRRPYPFVTAELFVQVWQSSDCVTEVARVTGLAYQTVVGRAIRYRKKGIALKRFPSTNGGREPLDIKRLSEIARKALK